MERTTLKLIRAQLDRLNRMAGCDPETAGVFDVKRKACGKGFSYDANTPGDRYGTRYSLVWYDGKGSYQSTPFGWHRVFCGKEAFSAALSAFMAGWEFGASVRGGK